ncbi:MAG: sigma-70 family RNA polymerase sigma factor [Minicystis sp.]
MIAPRPSAENAARAEHLRTVRILYRAFFAEAWDALGRFGLPDADRRAVAQRVVFAVYQNWRDYSADRGSPRQWIRGIARTEVRIFQRERRKGQPPGPVEDIEPATLPGAARTPEDTVSDQDLLEHLLAELSPESYRAVILHYVYGRTLAEIAHVERISVRGAHARCQAGMKALREAADRWKQGQEQRGVVPLPFVIEGLFASYRAPAAPSEVTEGAWSDAAADPGLDPASQSAPPSSFDAVGAEGDIDAAPGHLPRGARTGTRRLLSLLGLPVLLGGGVLGGFALGRCSHEPAHIESPVVVAAPAGSVIVAGTAAGTVETHAAVSVTTASAGAPPVPSTAEPARHPRSVKIDQERLRAEQALIEEAHTAFEEGHLAQALSMLAEHAQRFPQGNHAPMRARIRADVCREARRVQAKGLGQCAEPEENRLDH